MPEPQGPEGRAVVTRVYRLGNFFARLDEPIVEFGGKQVQDILVLGISMDPLNELFGTPRRPRGLPILAGMYWIEDQAMMERVIATDRPPPAEGHFLGRGQLSVKVG